MKQHDFDQMLSQLDTLSAKQRHSLIEWLHCPEEIPDIVEHLEQSLHDHLSCPHCEHDKIHRWGMSQGIQRYRCCGCHKTFTALTKTPLSGLRMRDRWMEYAQGMLQSEVLRSAAARCSIHLTTSFRWRHRFLKLAETLNAEALEGIVEADQTLFRESFKGKRNIDERPPRKRGNDKKKDVHWISVLVARDRHKHEADFVLKVTVHSEAFCSKLFLTINLTPSFKSDEALFYGSVHPTHTRTMANPDSAMAGQRLICSSVLPAT